MSDGFYLGRERTPGAESPGPHLALDPADLATHGLIVGMTGSGKTGLGIVLLEEALRQGVPVLAVDPKGDLANLLLLFEDLAPAAFEPWLDPELVRRSGKPAAAVAAETATRWREGLAGWGLGPPEIAALRRSHEARVLTPGSTAGTPLNVLRSLDAPRVPFAEAAEDLRDEIAGFVSGLLGLVGIAADALTAREHIVLSLLIEDAWRRGQSLGLEGLLAGLADPPFDKVGALSLETAFPRRERQGLMLALNNLLAAPSFQDWLRGEPLEIDALLQAPDGRPRLSVVYTAHLSDAERLFVTALLLDKLKTWVRAQPGTSRLRALFFMDEIFGYFPPHPADPPTKKPLLALLKQARAQGLGLVLSTQNPVDLDYKGLANIGTWFVGKLQTEQDRARLIDGLTGVGLARSDVERLLDATGKRVFLLHDVHRPRPALLESRWAMSFLRGPLTREEVARLEAARRAATAPAAASAGRDQAVARAPGAASAAGAAGTASAAAGVVPPALPEPFRHHYLARHGAALAQPWLLVKCAVRYGKGPEHVMARAWSLDAPAAAELLESEPVEVDETAVASAPPRAELRFAELPAWLDAGAGKAIERVLRERLPDKLALLVFEDPETGEESSPGETREAFAARLAAAGGGPAAAKVRARLEKKRQELAAKEQDLSGRRTEKWMAIGSAVLSNLGLLTGRKRRVSGAGSVLTKNRLEGTAEVRVEALRAEIAALEAELARLAAVDPVELRERLETPPKSRVTLLRYDVVWMC